MSCPPGKNLLGTGYAINTFNGQVILESLVPNEPLTSVSLGAVEDANGNTAVWSLTVYGMCALP